jgi:hypothetical protein
MQMFTYLISAHCKWRRTYHFKHSTKYSTKSASAFTNGEETTDSIISKMLSNLSCLVGFGRIFCTVFEMVCASSFAMCAYQIGEHLHLTFADHLDLYSQQANPNFRFPSEQIPLCSEWIMSLVWNIVFDRSSVMKKIKYAF